MAATSLALWHLQKHNYRRLEEQGWYFRVGAKGEVAILPRLSAAVLAWLLASIVAHCHLDLPSPFDETSRCPCQGRVVEQGWPAAEVQATEGWNIQRMPFWVAKLLKNEGL